MEDETQDDEDDESNDDSNKRKLSPDTHYGRRIKMRRNNEESPTTKKKNNEEPPSTKKRVTPEESLTIMNVYNSSNGDMKKTFRTNEIQLLKIDFDKMRNHINYVKSKKIKKGLKEVLKVLEFFIK